VWWYWLEWCYCMRCWICLHVIERILCTMYPWTFHNHNFSQDYDEGYDYNYQRSHYDDTIDDNESNYYAYNYSEDDYKGDYHAHNHPKGHDNSVNDDYQGYHHSIYDDWELWNSSIWLRLCRRSPLCAGWLAVLLCRKQCLLHSHVWTQ